MLTDDDIFLRLENTEDNTVERKTKSDLRDCVKAAVAFSNSLAVGSPGIVYLGVYNDGRIEETPKEAFESLQKKLSGEISNIYPPIYPEMLVRSKGGKHFLAMVVYGSTEKPHFAGKSYIRDGTRTVATSENQFADLIARRNSKAAQILEWKNKAVTLDLLNTEETVRRMGRVASSIQKTVRDCNQFYLTVEDLNNVPKMESIPLRRIELSYDHAASRLKLEVYPL